MKKTIQSVLIVLLGFTGYSQNDEITIDNLKAPSSVAFNLLGISPSSIDKPTDITSFAFSIQNATSDFTGLPKEYAMEFLPYTLFSKNPMTTKELGETKFKDVFKQSFLISLGMVNPLEEDVEADKPKITKLGAGFKFSIMRPRFDNNTRVKLDSIYEIQSEINKINADKNSLDPELILLKQEQDSIGRLPNSEAKVNLLQAVVEKIHDRRKELTNEKKDEKRQKLEAFVAKTDFNRQGFFLDFAGGLVTDFADETFNRSQITKAGVWLTGGWTLKKTWDIFLVGRYLYQPDKILADDAGVIKDLDDISTLDIGGRLIYRPARYQKLSLSSEAIYRHVLNNDLLAPSRRFVCNASYDFGNSKIVTFSFGKDFDNSYIKGKNLIAALNFIIGLGNSKVSNQ